MLGKNLNKLLVIVCLVSVALNIWLIGLALGNKAHEYSHGDEDKGSRFERKVQMLIGDLPPAAQKQFMTTMREYMPQSESDFSTKLEDLNHRLAETIKGENFDVEAAQKIFSEIRSSWAQIHMKFQEGFVRALQELSPEDRGKIAEALERKSKSL
ncbi:MAG: periplasmic heavy metal sensor [Thermodesulfobacteriota bacterium]